MARCVLVVQRLSSKASRGMLRLGGAHYACALGRSGCRARKWEGDGATPLGRFRLLEVLYRSDRRRRPRTRLPVRPIRRFEGWCDAMSDRNYNRRVRLPYPASAESLWREDAVYDIVVVLAHNTRPRKRGAGSAIFMHAAREGYSPTEGCVALEVSDLEGVLGRLGPGAEIVIG